MRVKVKISTTGHLFGETVIVDIGGVGANLQSVAAHCMAHGVIAGDRWISPLRIMEITEDVPEEKVVLRG